MIIKADSVCFLPSRLTEIDHPDHLGPPILIWRSLDNIFLCPVASLEDFLELWRSLGIAHDYLLFRRYQLRRSRGYYAGPFGALVSSRLLVLGATFPSWTPLLVVPAYPNV